MKFFYILCIYLIAFVPSNKLNKSNTFKQYEFNNGQNISFEHQKRYEYSRNSAENLIVSLSPSISSINKSHSSTIFKDFDKSHIEDMTHITSDNKEVLNTNNFVQIFKIKLKGKERFDYKDIIQDLYKNKDVISVEPDFTMEIELDSNDPYYTINSQRGLNGTNGIKANEVWNFNTGSSSVRVGIIDTGIQNHNDLNTNLDGGYDFRNNNYNYYDDNSGHGTHVAGIIGAIGNNNLGISGVNWNIKLVSLQCATEGTGISTTAVVQAINYATNLWGTNNQIDILNYSVSGLGRSTSVRAAISNFPGLFVWAAGNETTDIDTRVEANGSFDLPNLISVGNINQNAQREGSSNYSSSGNNVNIYAPGTSILSTYLNNSYEYLTGTSMAAPFVSGTAALMLSIDSSLTAASIKTKILNNSDTIQINIPTTNGLTSQQSVKKLNALKCGQSVHPHSFDNSHEWLDSKTHNSFCECGIYIKSGHFVAERISNNQRATCLLCGGTATMGFVVNGISTTNNQLKNQYETNNIVYFGDGSYKDHEGIYHISKSDYNKLLNRELKYPQ